MNGASKIPEMRNVFDQYSQPENQLTHALYCVLANEPKLIRPFLDWIGVTDIPLRKLSVVEQSVPGTAEEAGDGDDGLPDLCIYIENDDAMFGVFFEMKVQAKLTAGQLRRHAKTAIRFGFDEPILVAVTVDPLPKSLVGKTLAKQWREIYAWMATRQDESFWIAELVRYFEVFEEKRLKEQYGIRGTITMFNGLQFDEKRPYQYREAKRLIRLLGDELQERNDLVSEVGIDPIANRRPAITNDDYGSYVWDFIPLKVASGHDFIRFPHLTMSLGPTHAIAAVTVPNGISGGFKSRLKDCGVEGFVDLVRSVHHQLAPVLKQSNGSRSQIYATQRHYKTQRSTPQVDGRLEADLRTCIKNNESRVKFQPEWIEAIYRVLIQKRSNIQLGITARFDYRCALFDHLQRSIVSPTAGKRSRR